ncbi:MAG: beta-propeller fold lactonase family protein [Halomonas sp.]|nr:beta-propeller fold lactonase family protein [Halomonas sp.]
MNNNILAVTVLALGLSTTPLNADEKTFVYISNAGDGTITGFQLGDDGNLESAGTTEVAALVMPMAASPDGKVLYAATRAEPFTLYAWHVSPQDGSLDLLDTAPLGHNMLYVSTDRSGQYLLAASNSSNVITVTALDEEGRPASEPLFTQPTRHYTHAIRTNHLNTLAFAPTLGENAVEQFRFDVEAGALSHNEPQLAAIGEGAGPRHFVYSPDDRHLYVVNQFMGSVAGFVIDQTSGTLAPLGIFDA